MLPLREIDLMGVYVAPFALCLPVAFVGTICVMAVVRRVPVLDRPFVSPWLQLGVFTSLLSGSVLLLGRV